MELSKKEIYKKIAKKVISVEEGMRLLKGWHMLLDQIIIYLKNKISYDSSFSTGKGVCYVY